MKKLLYVPLLAALLSAAGCASLQNLDSSKLLDAGMNLVQAVSLSDKEIADLSRASVAKMDSQNRVADSSSAYDVRLKRLTKGITDANGTPLNFKVYLTSEVNAFACADGSIRIYSGLMDKMNDEELMAIIGHEIGHIVHTDVKDAMKNAYLSAAARSAVGSVEGSKLAALTDSQLGDIAVAFVGAQYSQKQEYAADDYGFEFSVRQGYDPNSMANSLNKLVSLSGGAQASMVQKMFSSHPDSAKRAKRMQEKADAYKAAQQK